jgi:hypothetical protein
MVPLLAMLREFSVPEAFLEFVAEIHVESEQAPR